MGSRMTFLRSVFRHIPARGTILSFDTETNGVNPMDINTLPLQIGWTEVSPEGDVVANDELFLNWPALMNDQGRYALQANMEKVAHHMNQKGKTYGITYQDLLNGAPVVETLQACLTYLETVVETGGAIGGFNFWRFDRPILERVMDRWAGRPWSLEGHQMIDAGLIEKAHLMDYQAPNGHDNIGAWYSIVGRHVLPKKWGLSDHMAAVYGLECDPSRIHMAGYDSLLAAQAILRMREVANRDEQNVPVDHAVSHLPGTW